MILHIDRCRLTVVIEQLDRQVNDRLEQFRDMGRMMADAGGGVEFAGFIVGSYAWTAWLEGWSNTRAPRRKVVGQGFDMTPAQELEATIAWLRAIGVGEEQVGQAVAVFRRGYTPEALGETQ